MPTPKFNFLLVVDRLQPEWRCKQSCQMSVTCQRPWKWKTLANLSKTAQGYYRAQGAWIYQVDSLKARTTGGIGQTRVYKALFAFRKLQIYLHETRDQLSLVRNWICILKQEYTGECIMTARFCFNILVLIWIQGAYCCKELFAFNL